MDLNQKNKNKFLMITLIILTLGNIFLNVLSIKRSSGYLGAMPFLSQAPSVKNFCSQSFLQIISKSPHKLFFNEQIYKGLSDPDFYSNAGIRGDEEISWLRVGEGNKTCRLISRDKKGFRYWKMGIEESIDNPLIYKIIALYENDPKDLKEVWK